MVEFKNTPLKDVIQATENLYGELNCEIYFGELQNSDGAYGITHFYTDGGVGVGLDVDTPYRHMVEILAHELAHVVVNQSEEDDHGEKWQETFDKIYDEYNRYGDEKYGKQ